LPLEQLSDGDVLSAEFFDEQQKFDKTNNSTENKKKKNEKLINFSQRKRTNRRNFLAMSGRP
jgi:hypothetical protein